MTMVGYTGRSLPIADEYGLPVSPVDTFKAVKKNSLGSSER